MAKASRVSKFDKEYDSYSDITVTTGVEVTLTTADTNRAIPIPNTASFVEVYGSTDFRMSLSSGLAAKGSVADTDSVAGNLTEGNFVIGTVIVARQLPASPDRVLYIRSASAGCIVQINFLG
jgi:hypothetical protein